MSAAAEGLVDIVDQNITVIRTAFDELQRTDDKQIENELEDLIVVATIEAGTALVQLLARVLVRYARA